MLKKFTFSLMAIIALSLVAIAQDDKKEIKWTGYLTDTACATGKMAKAPDSAAAAASHTKGCVLGCLNSGLGIYADGKFTAFDAKGNDLAKAALEKSKKDQGAKFEVTGKVIDGKLAVASISEVE